jgi:hypothetical protein
MLRSVGIFCILVAAFPSFCQSTSKWHVGKIIEVKVHQAAEKQASSEVASYDVSLRVGDTIYLVLYTPLLSDETVKYSAGHELLVSVGKSTIRYNDMLGRSYEVPIESKRPAANSRGTESASRAAQ